MAARKIKVKPNPDKVDKDPKFAVKHPFNPNQNISESGEEILDCPWTRRRLREGDLVRCDTEDVKSPSRAKKKAEGSAKPASRPNKKASKKPKKTGESHQAKNKTIDDGDSDATNNDQ